MRVLVEALAADFGGIRTYVECLLPAWAEAFPDDEVVVLVAPGSDLATGPHRRLELAIPRPATLGRPLAQTLRTRRVVRDERIDVVLATLPSTGMRHPGAPLAVVVHDLRHELRPAQFSRGRRLLRRVSYDRAYALADLIVSVSQRTLDDLHRLHPATAATPSVVVHHGADHVLTWGGAAGTGPAVAFAHHTNKNPDLVIAGWADATSRGEPMPRLTLLGAGSDRERLAALAADRGVGHLVEPVPYLPDQELRGVFGNAAMVVLPSDLEGFGLPIVEGMLLGIPVVIGPDPAALEVAGGHAAVMDGWTPRALADAVAEAGRFDADRLVAARAHAAAFTWRRSAEQTRSALASISRP